MGTPPIKNSMPYLRSSVRRISAINTSFKTWRGMMSNCVRIREIIFHSWGGATTTRRLFSSSGMIRTPSLGLVPWAASAHTRGPLFQGSCGATGLTSRSSHGPSRWPRTSPTSPPRRHRPSCLVTGPPLLPGRPPLLPSRLPPLLGPRRRSRRSRRRRFGFLDLRG